MELVKKLKENRKVPKLRETRFGIVSFVFALLTLAYLNIFLMTLSGMELFSSFFLQAIPAIGVISGVLSLTRVNYKKTFTWWAFALYLFMVVCILMVGFFEFAIYPKP